MNAKPTWWKLYTFAAVMCAALFVFRAANQTVLLLWMVVVYGGIMVWMNQNQTQLNKTVHYRYEVTVVKPPVAEFFDEDRVYLQQLDTEITEDNFKDSPHEAA